MGVLIFKGMSVGFQKNDLSISFDESGQLHAKAILSTSYNILPIWLRIAHDNVALAKNAAEAIVEKWNEDGDNQRKLLLAELTPAVQTFVACGIAYDAFYEQIKSFASISESEVAAWRKNRTSRASQITEVIRRVYKLQGAHFVEVQKIIKQIMKLRDKAVHPSHALQQAMNRPDLPVSVDWRFCAFRHENASVCYRSTMGIFTYLRQKTSPLEEVNQGMETVFEALEEMGLIESEPNKSDETSFR